MNIYLVYALQGSDSNGTVKQNNSLTQADIAECSY